MISLQRVTKTYKNGVTALTDVDVEVEKGEFVFIVGQSGSGKSTMIRLLIREEDVTKGSIYVGGKNLAKMSSWDIPKLRRNVGTVFLRCTSSGGGQTTQSSPTSTGILYSEHHHSLAMATLVDDSKLDDGWASMNRGSMTNLPALSMKP